MCDFGSFDDSTLFWPGLANLQKQGTKQKEMFVHSAVPASVALRSLSQYHAVWRGGVLWLYCTVLNSTQ